MSEKYRDEASSPSPGVLSCMCSEALFDALNSKGQKFYLLSRGWSGILVVLRSKPLQLKKIPDEILLLQIGDQKPEGEGFTALLKP